MKQIRLLAQYYVDLMVKLGLVRFSLLLASALVVLAMIVQMAVTMVLRGHVESIDMVRSVFFGLLITPWAVYFLSVVGEQLEESRQRLARLVDKLEEMRHRDLELNQQMKENITQLNQEIADRIKAEEARLQVMTRLKEEMARREQAQIELEQQSSFLRSFLDASPDLVFYRNSDQDRRRSCYGCSASRRHPAEYRWCGWRPADRRAALPSRRPAQNLSPDRPDGQFSLPVRRSAWRADQGGPLPAGGPSGAAGRNVRGLRAASAGQGGPAFHALPAPR